MKKELDLVKRRQRHPRYLSNNDKPDVVCTLCNTLLLPMLLKAVGLATSNYYYRHSRRGKPDKHAHLSGIDSRNTSKRPQHLWVSANMVEVAPPGDSRQRKVVWCLVREEGISPRYAKRTWKYSSYQGEIDDAPPTPANRNFHAERRKNCGLQTLTPWLLGRPESTCQRLLVATTARSSLLK